MGSIFSVITGIGGIYLYFSKQIIIDKTLLIISIVALLIFVRLTLKEASYFENFFIKVIVCVFIYPSYAILYYRFILALKSNDLISFYFQSGFWHWILSVFIIYGNSLVS